MFHRHKINRPARLQVPVSIGLVSLTLDGSAVTEFLSALTEDVMALVSLGKSPLAELTSVLASLWICLSCDFSPLIPLLVSPLTEFWRSVRSVQ